MVLYERSAANDGIGWDCVTVELLMRGTDGTA